MFLVSVVLSLMFGIVTWLSLTVLLADLMQSDVKFSRRDNY